MRNFFSFVTDPINHPAEYYFLDWVYRKANLDDEGVDSHSHICAHFNLNEDRCNKYEYNPLTKMFTVDQINSKRDDSEAAEKWVKRLDFKTVVEPLIVKPIVNPLELPKVEHVTDEQIGWLKEWSSVRASVLDSVRDLVWSSVRDLVGDSVRVSVRDSVRVSVWASVGSSVMDSVWDSVGSSVGSSVRDLVLDSVRDLVGASVWASVMASAGDSVGTYIGSFFAINYKYNFSSVANLWNAGLVPSFDGNVWRLHSGKKADVVYEWTPEVTE